MEDLKFSDRYNSMHGIEEFLTVMLDMNATANAAVDRLRMEDQEGDLKIPSSKWVRDRFKGITPSEMEEIVRSMIDMSIASSEDMRALNGDDKTIIIDPHNISQYDKKNRSAYSLSTKAARGTTKSAVYAIA